MRDDASGQSSDVRGVGASVEAVGEGAEEQRFDEAEDGLDDAPHRHDAHVRGDAVDGAVPRAQVHHQRLGQGNRRHKEESQGWAGSGSTNDVRRNA